MSLLGGVQLVLDAALVSAHHGDGTPLRKANTTNGVAPRHARKRKEDRYPELCGQEEMVVIAGEMGGSAFSVHDVLGDAKHAVSGTILCDTHPLFEQKKDEVAVVECGIAHHLRFSLVCPHEKSSVVVAKMECVILFHLQGTVFSFVFVDCFFPASGTVNMLCGTRLAQDK